MRLAVAVYQRVLDRVERIDFDVLGRATGRAAPWQLPGAVARGAARDDAPGDPARAPSARRCDARADVLICGASFAGLAVARELAGSGADVLVVDRYEIGERQTSRLRGPDAVAARRWASRRAIRQELPCMAFHTPHGSARFRLPWSWSAFDYRTLCEELWEQCDARFEIAKVERARRATTVDDRPRRRSRRR